MHFNWLHILTITKRIIVIDSPKISHMTKRDIFQLNFSRSDEKYDESAVVQILAVFGTLYGVDCQKVF